MKVVPLLALSLTQLSEAYLAAGRRDDARNSVQKALQLCRAHRQRLFEPDALRIEGDVRARNSTGEASGAEESYTNALALAGELSLRPLVAHCHLSLSKLYCRTGKREQAREHFTIATTMYRDMGMTYWREKVEAEMRGPG